MTSYLKVIAQEWSARSEDLASWTVARLVNRTDVWGSYLPSYGRKKNASGYEQKMLTVPFGEERGVKQLARDVIVRHYVGASNGHIIGLHAIGPDNRSRWFAVDIDLHEQGHSVTATPEGNLSAALSWWRKLSKLGFDPILLDSNGAGGCHLVVLLAEPAPTGDVHAFVQDLVSDFEKRGLARKPETFPSKAHVEEGHYGTILRLPGRIALGITQDQLADMVGVSRQTVNKHEEQQYQLADVDLLTRVCEALGLLPRVHVRHKTLKVHQPARSRRRPELQET